MSTPAKQVSLLFLMEDNKILLAMKKRGFGVGRWNGVGGKPEPGETIEQTAVRECQEEIGVTPLAYKQVATLDFYFSHSKGDWDQRAIVYECSKWAGEPTETEEMRPQWFTTSTIPYADMWEDDELWLPKVLAGNFIVAAFTFDEHDHMLSSDVSIKNAV